MTMAILSALLFAAAFSAAHFKIIESTPIDSFYFQLDNGTIIKEDLTQPIARPKAFNPDAVTFCLYTRKTGVDKPCCETVAAMSCPNWKNCGFDPHKETKFLIHGYLGSHTGEAMKPITGAYCSKKDVNLIAVDYNSISKPYFTAVSSTKNIGLTAAKAVKYLEENCGIDPKKGIECVGHSLGAHICGLFCAALPQKCARIFALDPADPIISGYNNDGKLDQDDAENVQCIHTSKDGLGMARAFCDIDFFVNGAKGQYGCGNNQVLGNCDHMKACNLFADTILHGNSFTTNLKCSSTKNALAGDCEEGPWTCMGDPNDKAHTGIYYIDSKPIYERILNGQQ